MKTRSTRRMNQFRLKYFAQLIAFVRIHFNVYRNANQLGFACSCKVISKKLQYSEKLFIIFAILLLMYADQKNWVCFRLYEDEPVILGECGCFVSECCVDSCGNCIVSTECWVIDQIPNAVKNSKHCSPTGLYVIFGWTNSL